MGVVGEGLCPWCSSFTIHNQILCSGTLSGKITMTIMIHDASLTVLKARPKILVYATWRIDPSVLIQLTLRFLHDDPLHPPFPLERCHTVI